MLRVLGLVFVGACIPAFAVAETVYINDMLRVGVRAKPNSSDAPLEIVTTGDKLQVLERRGGFLMVRTQRGTEGWINDAYATAETPARERAKTLAEENARLQSELDELKALSGVAEENQRLKERVAQLQAEVNAPPETAAASAPPATAATVKLAGPDQRTWLLQAGLMLATFVAGALFGVWRYRHRVAERFNGLDL